MSYDGNSMNRRVLNLAVPNIISNITIPLLGMVDTAIAGRLGSDTTIGAVAIGTSIFNFIYWNCAFLRMGTSGMTAQALGASDLRQSSDILVRSFSLAVVIALLLLVFRVPLGCFSLRLMQGSSEVTALAAEYFFARIWAAPASVSLFALNGWFIGMQNARIPMWVAICSNIVNVAFCLLFVFHYSMGVAGLGWGAVVAQYFGLAMSLVLLAVKWRHSLPRLRFRESMRLKPLLRFFNINKDIFLRTLCVVVVYTFFTAASSHWGDRVLAVNSLLMQLFTLFSYMSDGFAYSAESLTGLFVGMRNEGELRRCIRALVWWSGGIAVSLVAAYLFGWRWLLGLFTTSTDIIEAAGSYVGWVVLVPLAGFLPFLIDGIMLGATQTKVLRNTVFISTAIYFVVFYSLRNVIGNNALWLAFISFVVARGVLLYFATDRINPHRLIEGAEH